MYNGTLERMEAAKKYGRKIKEKGGGKRNKSIDVCIEKGRK